MPVVVPSGAGVITAPTDSTSVDEAIRAVDDPAYGGVRVLVDYTQDRSRYTTPFRCTVYRQTPDGTVSPVRGGDPWVSYAARGWLYDQEAPLGAVVQYYAVPTLSDGTQGARSSGAVIQTTAPKGGYQDPGVWLVSLETPADSMQVRTQASLGGSYAARVDKQIVLGSPYPAVTTDTRNALSTTMTVLTAGQDEYTRLLNLINQNVLFRKSIDWERPDGYFIVEDATAQALSRLGNGYYGWSLTLTQVSMPTTYGQTPEIPGRSFADRLSRYPLFSDSHVSSFGGNLLNENTSGLETDTSGWTARANTTTAWTTAQAYRGTHSMQMTAGASGSFGAATATAYPVTPGVPYLFTAHLYATLPLTASLQFDWADVTRTYLSSDSLSGQGEAVSLVQNNWLRVQLRATAPANAAYVTPLFDVTATAAGQVAYADYTRVEAA